MADLLQQAEIGDDPAFRARVRQAIIARAIEERLKPAEQTNEAARALALAVLERTDEWSLQIARALATVTGDHPNITQSDQVDDAALRAFLDPIFVAYM